MVGQETLSITANKRNCLTMLYLDNCVMGIGSIRLFATVSGYITTDRAKQKVHIFQTQKIK